MTKLSPYQLVFGRLPRLPVDVALGEVLREIPRDTVTYDDFLDTITETRKYAKMLMEEASATHVSDMTLFNNPYKVGDLVWIYTPVVKVGDTKKLTLCWKGPFEVKELKSQVNCVVKDVRNPNKEIRIHIARLKPYVKRNKPEGFPNDLRLDENVEDVDVENFDEGNPTQSIVESGSVPVDTLAPEEPSIHDIDQELEVEVPVEVRNGKEYYEAEKILGQKYRQRNGKKTRYYLVKWKGYSDKWNSWVPYYNLRNTDLISRYHQDEEDRMPK